MNTLVKMLASTDVFISKTYVFEDDKFIYTSEIISKIKPEYSFSTGEFESEPLTEKEFKEIEAYLDLYDASVLPFEKGVSIFALTYKFSE